MYLKLALRNIFRNRSRSFITLLAIASGASALILAGGFIEDTIVQLRESYIRDFLGHLRIYKPGYQDQGLMHPFDYMISDPQSVIQRIQAVPHVLYTAPRLSFAGLLSNGESTISFFAEGTDPQVETQSRHAIRLESGEALDQPKGFEILLGKGLARALGAKPGDGLIVVANTRRGAINASDVTVRGIFATSDKAYDDRAARLPLATVQRLLRTDDVQSLVVFLDDTSQVDAVKRQLETKFRDAGFPYEVKAWYELEEADFVRKAVAFYQRMFSVLKIMLIIVVTLSVINTMNMAVLERIGEIGTLMAIGTPPDGILRLFLLEGILMGLCGAVVGCLSGLGLGLLVTRIGIPMPSPPGSTVHWIAHVAIVPDVYVFAFLMAVMTALISSVFPAWRASHLVTADALRHNI